MNRAANPTLVRNITHLRQSQQLTQENMSQMLNITRSRLAGWEEYRSNPPIACLITLSSIFSVSVDDLIQTDIRSQSVRDPFYFNL